MYESQIFGVIFLETEKINLFLHFLAKDLKLEGKVAFIVLKT